MKLQGKVAIVTGGTSGIGLAIVERFVREGASVVVASRGGEAFAALRKKMPSLVCVRADVRSEDDIKRILREAVSAFGRIDIIVNNAGIALEKSIEATDLAEYENVMATDMASIFMMTKHAMPHLRESRGTIINIASKLGIIPDPEVPVYSTAKAAVVMFTKNAALAYAKEGVRINCICPGPVATDLLKAYFQNEEEMRAFYAEHNPMGRVGMPDEVANVAAFLASDEASYVTAGIYTVDGGGYLTN